jgi:nucleoside-diphosphate-sugar epimerase
MKTVVIIGCGDIGQRVARLYQQKGTQHVYGLVRSDETISQLETQSITAIRGDLSQVATLQALPTKEATLFYFAPPPKQGTTDPYLRNFLSTISGDNTPAKIILISTTAVYGDCQGAWITEKQPVNPQTDRGKRRLDAEIALQEWSQQTGVPIVILRVGGIYGPGRYPIARLQKGLPILREGESPYTNRIHQDDLAMICIAAAERGEAGEIYNVADGQPGTMSGYFKTVARAAGLPVPPEVSRSEAEHQMTPGMISYLRESRRLDNRKLLQGLQVSLRYPNLETGLKQDELT